MCCLQAAVAAMPDYRYTNYLTDIRHPDMTHTSLNDVGFFTPDPSSSSSEEEHLVEARDLTTPATVSTNRTKQRAARVGGTSLVYSVGQ